MNQNKATLDDGNNCSIQLQSNLHLHEISPPMILLQLLSQLSCFTELLSCLKISPHKSLKASCANSYFRRSSHAGLASPSSPCFSLSVDAV